MYANTPDFEPSVIECPDCGALNNAEPGPTPAGNTRFVVDDGGLVVVFEAECPCGWRSSTSIDADGRDGPHPGTPSLDEYDAPPDDGGDDE